MHESYSTASRKRKRAGKPQSLLSFIRDAGGIDPGQPEAGDLRSMDVMGERRVQFRTGNGKDKPRVCKLRTKRDYSILRHKPGQGRTPDTMCELAVEAGYFPGGSDINDLLNAIDLELREIRKFYPLQDVDAVHLPPDAEAPEPERPKRGRGRPPKLCGALVHAPSIRIGADDLEALALAAHNLGMPLRTFARKCLLTGLRIHNGEGF